MSRPFKVRADETFEHLWQKQSGRCALCGGVMYRNRYEAPHARVWAKDRATIDHIIPISKGGRDGISNLKLDHARCNKIKGKRT